jgi:hypothetical protein
VASTATCSTTRPSAPPRNGPDGSRCRPDRRARQRRRLGTAKTPATFTRGWRRCHAEQSAPRLQPVSRCRCRRNRQAGRYPARTRPSPALILESIGRNAKALVDQALALLSFVGEIAIAFASWIRPHPLAADSVQHPQRRLRRPAHRRAAVLPARHRRRLSGRRPAAPIRRQHLRRRSGRAVDAARIRAADHRHHHRRPLGLGLCRADRHHGGDRGNRRHAHHRHRAAGAPGAAQNHRAG